MGRETENTMTLLEKLDWLMDKYGLNKSTLSKNSKIAYTTIDSLYKKGYQNAKLSTLMALSRYFNVSLDYLANDEIDNPRYGFDEIYSENELKILELYRNADERTQDIVNLALDFTPKGNKHSTTIKKWKDEHKDQ